MAIDPFLTGQAFDPKAIREISLALDSVCNALGVRNDDEVTTRLVAEKIIQLAGHGMPAGSRRRRSVTTRSRLPLPADNYLSVIVTSTAASGPSRVAGSRGLGR
jgi:hypothetical protein